MQGYPDKCEFFAWSLSELHFKASMLMHDRGTKFTGLPEEALNHCLSPPPVFTAPVFKIHGVGDVATICIFVSEPGLIFLG